MISPHVNYFFFIYLFHIIQRHFIVIRNAYVVIVFRLKQRTKSSTSLLIGRFQFNEICLIDFHHLKLKTPNYVVFFFSNFTEFICYKYFWHRFNIFFLMVKKKFINISTFNEFYLKLDELKCQLDI